MPREKRFNEEDVIRKFTDVFWEKGYSACSVGDLVAASGLSRSSIYDTFGDKEQLFVRCLQYYSARVQENLIAGTENKRSPLEKIEAALLMPFSSGKEESDCKGCMAVNTMGELGEAPIQAQELVLNTKAGFEQFVTNCLHEGLSDQSISIRESPESVAALLYTVLCGMLLQQKAGAKPALIRDNVSVLMKLLTL